MSSDKVDDWRDDNVTWIKKLENIDTWNMKIMSVRKELIVYLARTIIQKRISNTWIEELGIEDNSNDINSLKEIEDIYEKLYNSSLDELIKTASDNSINIDKIIERYRFF